MEKVFYTGLIILFSLSGLSAKHVFIRMDITWESAQAYCRKHYTDLSPITNEFEDEVFRRFVEDWFRGWIGLYRDPISPSGWKWSGGANATYLRLANYYTAVQSRVHWSRGNWHSILGTRKSYFFCFNLMVDEVKKTWEEALEHCRETHTDLTSLHSETETLLALSEVQNNHITEPVWIGLRFLGDRWLWVNGEPFWYQAWPEGDQDHECPIWKRCGALTKEGVWKSWDCQEKLHFICY